jgi:hypothetical protein
MLSRYICAHGAVLARNGGGRATLTPLFQVEAGVRQCLIADRNRADLGSHPRVNWPDTQRHTIDDTAFATLRDWFFALQGDNEFSRYYPRNLFRFEVATSGSGGRLGVHDLKISPRAGGASVFNYHVTVVATPSG